MPSDSTISEKPSDTLSFRILTIGLLAAIVLVCPLLVYAGGSLGLALLVAVAGILIGLFTHPLVPFTIYFGALFFEDTQIGGLPVSINQIIAPVFFLSAFVYFLRGRSLVPKFSFLPLLAVVALYFALNGLFSIDFDNGILYARYTIVYLVLAVCLAMSLSSERSILAFAWIVVALTAVAAAHGLVQAFQKNILGAMVGHWGSSNRINGTAANPIVFGWNMVYAFPFAFLLFSEMRSKYTRALAIFLGTFILGIAALTFNRQTFVVIAVVVCLSAILYSYKNRAVFLGTLSILGVISAFTVLPLILKRILTVTHLGHDVSYLERRDSLLMGGEMFRQHPIFGVGFGAFSKIWKQFIPPDYPTYFAQYRGSTYPKFPDMGMVTVVVETGIVGGILFFVLLVAIFSRAWKYRREAIRHNDSFAKNLASTALVILVFFVLTSFIQDTFLYPRIWIYYGFVLLLDQRIIPIRKSSESEMEVLSNDGTILPDPCVES